MKNIGLLLSIGFVLVSNLNGQGRIWANIDTGYCSLMPYPRGMVDDFHYPKTGPNLIVIGSVALGNNPGYVVDAFYSVSARRIDWRGDSVRQIMPPLWSSEMTCQVSIWDTSTSGVKIRTSCYWIARGTRYYPGYDDFIIMIYDFTNVTDTAIANLFAGVLIDFDLGTSPMSNWGSSDVSKRFTYMWPSSSTQDPCVGVRLLYPRTATNLSLIDHAYYVYPPTQMTEQTKFSFLNGTIRLSGATRAYDYSICVSSTPFNLASHAKQRVAYAIIGGTDSLKAKEHSDSAQSWYDREVKVEETKSQKLETRHDFKIWSNPAKSDVRLQITHVANKDLKIRIYDITGKLVKDMSRSIVAGVWFGVSLNPGIYFVRLETEAAMVTKKVVVVE